jgi:hypothetical protein
MVSKSLIELGYTPAHTDPCLFYKREGSWYSIFGLYVDDCIYFGNHKTWQQELRDLFIQKYQVTKFSRNKLSYLGLNIINYPDNGYTSIDQIVYIDSIIEKYGLQYKDFKSRQEQVLTPSTAEFFQNDDTLPTDNCDQQLFRSTIMALLYVAKRTRPDILFETIYLTSRNGKANIIDFKKLHRIMSYLTTTRTKKLEFWRTDAIPISIDVFADASHMVHVDLKGHTGCVIMFNGNMVYTISKKQNLVAESSCESELYAVHHAGHMARWISNLLQDLTIHLHSPIRILQDNQSTIKLVDKGYGQFGRTKHIQKRFFSLKDLISNNVAVLLYLPTDVMVADMLTKPLPYQLHSKFSKAIMQGLLDVGHLISKGSVRYLDLNKTKDTRSQVARIRDVRIHLFGRSDSGEKISATNDHGAWIRNKKDREEE